MNRWKRIGIGFVLIVIILCGIYVYSGYNPEEYRFFPKCPVYLLTGYKCPGCGSQRAFYHLFHGDVKAAFSYNPLMLLMIPYILSGIFLEYIVNRENRRMARLRNLLFNKWVAIVLAAMLLIYTFVRNL